MALFSSKKTPLQSLLAGDWQNTDERDIFLKELRSSPPRATELQPLVWHTDPKVRTTGAELFLAKPDKAAVRELVASFSSRPPQAQQAVIPLLGRLPPELVTGAVDDLLSSTQGAESGAAWQLAMALPGPLGVRYLERGLQEAPPALRLKALQRLAQSGQIERYQKAVAAATKVRDARVRKAALEALATVRSSDVLPLMVERLGDGDEAVRGVAEAYLRRAAQDQPAAMREAMTRLLTRGSDDARHLAMHILLECGAPQEVVPHVLELCQGMAGWLRSRVMDSLRSAGDKVLGVALSVMQQADSPVRTEAIMMLAEGYEDPRLVEPFCRLLGDSDWWLRVTACQVLGNLGDTRAVPSLVKTLEDPDTRWAAVDALAQIGAPQSLKPLSQLLRDPRPEVRMEVLQAFSRFNDERLVPVLQSVRDKDGDADVRGRAADILRHMGQRAEAESATAANASRLTSPLDKLLLRIREMGASDLHLTVGEPPLVRIDGVLRRMDGVGKLAPEHTRAYVQSMLDEEQRQELEKDGGLDFCHVTEGVGRYRANAYVQRRGVCASFRVIANTPPSFEDLRLPNRLKELLDFHQGIIIISGPAGSGKSTTLTALANLINDTKPLHVITLEDPIEFIHPIKTALINQRQVGRDTRTFATGLRAALREDPDVIVVGDLRDADTMGLALQAAETGHLVIATLHTTSAVQTIDRLVDSFPPEEQAQVRTSLSESLKYVVCQRLLPHKSGKGRVAMFEIIKGTLSIGNKIRKNETFLIPGLMQIGMSIGMRTRDQALQELVEADLIRRETAAGIADKPERFGGGASASSATGGGAS